MIKNKKSDSDLKNNLVFIREKIEKNNRERKKLLNKISLILSLKKTDRSRYSELKRNLREMNNDLHILVEDFYLLLEEERKASGEMHSRESYFISKEEMLEKKRNMENIRKQIGKNEIIPEKENVVAEEINVIPKKINVQENINNPSDEIIESKIILKKRTQIKMRRVNSLTIDTYDNMVKIVCKVFMEKMDVKNSERDLIAQKEFTLKKNDSFSEKILEISRWLKIDNDELYDFISKRLEKRIGLFYKEKFKE